MDLNPIAYPFSKGASYTAYEILVTLSYIGLMHPMLQLNAYDLNDDGIRISFGIEEQVKTKLNSLIIIHKIVIFEM